MISLSDSELSAVMDAAQPLAPNQRDAFLRDVADQLSRHLEVGPGTVARAIREVQAKYFHGPVLQGRVLGKWHR